MCADGYPSEDYRSSVTPATPDLKDGRDVVGWVGGLHLLDALTSQNLAFPRSAYDKLRNSAGLLASPAEIHLHT